MKKYYIVTAIRKDDKKFKRKFPVSGDDIVEATKKAFEEIDSLWEIIKIKIL